MKVLEPFKQEKWTDGEVRRLRQDMAQYVWIFVLYCTKYIYCLDSFIFFTHFSEAHRFRNKQLSKLQLETQR